MSVTPDQFDTPIPRDRYGRPMVMLPDSDKRVAYRRTTTFVGVLEDTYNLMQWKQRQTALGLAARKDLMLGVIAAEADDKKTLNGLCEQAVEAAQSGAKATIGTALHSFTEQLDRGLDISHIPHPYDRDMEAYRRATDGMEHVAIEQFRVFDSWQVAGTADRVVNYRGGTYIADVKTGDVEWGALKISMQLAMYSHSVPYVGDKRVQDGQPVDTTRGIVIHLPAGTGECRLHWVDLTKGWRACQTAFSVWEARGWKRELMWPVADEPDNPVRLAGDVLETVKQARSEEELRELWQEMAKQGALDHIISEAILARRDQILKGEQ